MMNLFLILCVVVFRVIMYLPVWTVRSAIWRSTFYYPIFFFYFSIYLMFFNPWISYPTAVMNCFMIKPGPPDSSDGPDLICLSQTHNPSFRPVWPIQDPVIRTDPFSCLSPKILYCFVKCTTVFNYYTISS